MNEWRAFYRLEPWGDLVADQRHGIATSVLANINRNPKTRREPYLAKDFIHWRESNIGPQGPVLLSDPQAQANLIKQTLFKDQK